MVWYGMVWYGMVWYGMVWYGMVWTNMVWYARIWHNTLCYGICLVVWYGISRVKVRIVQPVELPRCGTTGWYDNVNEQRINSLRTSA